MSRIAEAAFMPIVAGDLSDRFGDDNVFREPELPSGRIPDFIAHGPAATWAVEVENDTDDLAEAVGQSQLYAAEYGAARHAEPLVYVPDPVEDYAELQTARDVVRVLTLSPDP
ncbi:hypothetical protein C2R22_06005 [Salinigranum rubrum]|uniref:Restriction endonuclease domain-containing protein n=1 Tax=Salinigranum rubrum TaxID=755307 RepID=A0A2I8VH63_9EURY|nr:hypothetical protein [Salinigranum rubrum]AUV81272.1 hypothetical protein C2R22_06005 [Salinigranum rubrum]